MRKFLTTAGLTIGAALLSQPAAAQSGVEVRVDRLEGQMRAVQRKVFPSVNGKLIQPEITGREAASARAGSPSDGAVNDLTARIDALESEQRTLTAQVEQNQYDIRQLKDGFTAYKRATDAQLQAMKDTSTTPRGAADDSEPARPTTRPAPPTRRPTTPAPTTPMGTTPTSTTSTGGTRPTTSAASTRDPARARLVAAVQKPATDDAGEDTYNYGYRLWEAKLYPEAEAQFKSLVKTDPQHRRASRAQNMLGRSLLDDDKPNLAVLAFYDNYRSNPKGDRAHESLYYLAEALTRLKKPASEICKVYDELTDVYPDKLSDTMKAGVARGRVVQKCPK